MAEDPDTRRQPASDSREREQRSRLVELLDRTQGHLILRWNAWLAPETLRRVGLSTLYCFIALFFLVVFALESFLENRTGHAQVLLMFGTMTVGIYVYLRATGDRHVSDAALVFLLALLCLFLLHTGGIDGTGPLWYFVYPLFAMFVMRLWAGILAVVGLLVVTLLSLSFPIAGFDTGMYTQHFIERLLAVYITVSVMAFFYAFLRASAELEMSQANTTLQALANTDGLTRLPNRRAMEDMLYREVSRSTRAGSGFSVILMDMDGFKRINDQLGHAAGDRVLQAVPGMTESALRRQDICGRWGGEEFMVVLPETSLEGAAHVAERLRAVIETHPVLHHGREFKVTASFGVSEFQRSESLGDCLRRADENLYRAKREGRNRVVAQPHQS